MSAAGQFADIAANDRDERAIRICFFFNAQRHQLLHGVSTAVELARMPGFAVQISSPSPDHIAYARKLVERLGGAPVGFSVESPALLTAIRQGTGKSVPPKLLSLAMLARHLNGFDAIAIPERTSMMLKRLGASSPHFVHLDHGAGDRAAGFDRRIRLFDMVLMAGEKHRDRLGREGLIHEGGYAVVGYPKFDAVDAIRDPDWTPFKDRGKPVVLYNPHFSSLGSWEKFGILLLRAFAMQSRYNLIVAPHVRMLDGRKKRERWASIMREFEPCDHIAIDPGSDRSIDMTYTSLADVYVGDVSSQVYEFLRTPKPCLFLDAHDVAWEADENYGHWRFGPVLRSPDDIIGAIDAARESHPQFRDAQIEGFEQTFATGTRSASLRAATAIAEYLRKNAGARAAGRRARPVQPLVQRVQRAAVLGLAVFGGWAMHDMVGPLSSPAQAETPFVDEAVISHQTTLLRAAMKSQPEITDLDPAEILRVTGIKVPQLPASWRVTDVQIYPSRAGPIVQVAALTEHKEAVSLVAMHIDTPAGDSPILTSHDGDQVAYWEEGDKAFGIVGTIPSKRLLLIASKLAEQS